MSTEISVERGSRRVVEATTFSIILALSFSHFLNDTMQSLVPALYPMFKDSYGLSFAQIGLITLVMQLTSSMLQPVVGLIADYRPRPYSLSAGMGSTFGGLLLLAHASDFRLLLVAAAMVGIGSAVFHPEASRVARLASGGRHGLAQSLFQVGGNVGSAIGPILAAFIVIPRGQGTVGWFSGAALVAMTVLFGVGSWYSREHPPTTRRRVAQRAVSPDVSRRKLVWSLIILLALIFSKSFYQASLSSYYIFYLMNKFHVSVANAQLHLFAFLAAVAIGTLIGGPLGDRIGRKYVIWGSIVGVIPFTMTLPYVGLWWTGILTVVIGLTLASATASIIVYALDLVPGKIGTISGLFFGLSFGLAGIGAAALGRLADATSIDTVYHVCAFLPMIGLLTAFLPNIKPPAPPAERREERTAGPAAPVAQAAV